MSDSLIEAPAQDPQTTQLPDTEEECGSYLELMDTQLQTSMSLVYWVFGRVISHMRNELEIEHPLVGLKSRLGLADRLLRYCESTFLAYSYEELAELCQHRMKWSTVRELCSSTLDEQRAELMQDFLEGRYTDLELREHAVEARKNDKDGNSGENGEERDNSGELGDDLPDEGLRKEFRNETKKTRETVKKVGEQASTYEERMRRSFADLLLDPDGTVNEEMEERQTALLAELKSSQRSLVDLTNCVSLMLGISDFPLEELKLHLEDVEKEYNA